MKIKITGIGLVALVFLMSQVSCWAGPWPDSPKKQKIFESSAQSLLSSIDTNQTEWICSKIITNLSKNIRLENKATQNGAAVVTLANNEDIALKIKKFSSRVKIYLKKYADPLTATNIYTYSSDAGYCATISDSQGDLFYNLWFDSGPVKYFNLRSKTGEVLINANFYQDGKLKSFEEKLPNDEELIFNTNGKISGYNWTTTNNIEVDVNFDDAGNIKIRGFNLNK